MNNISPDNTKRCLLCKRKFFKRTNESVKDWARHKFCSRKCGNDSRKGKPFFDSTGIPSWNKGRTGYMSKEGRKRIGESTRRTLKNLTKEQVRDRINKTVKTRKARNNYKGQLGKTKEQIYAWKGDKASYSSKHKWIQKHWIKTGICENCGVSPKPYGRRKFGTEWHSIDNKYNREDRTTWMEVCKKCHFKLDKEL